MLTRASRLEYQRQDDKSGPLIPPRSLSHQPRPRPPLPLPHLLAVKASARSQSVDDEQYEYNGDACVSHLFPLPLGHHRVPVLPDASYFPHSARLEPRRLIKSHFDLLLAKNICLYYYEMQFMLFV